MWHLPYLSTKSFYFYLFKFLIFLFFTFAFLPLDLKFKTDYDAVRNLIQHQCTINRFVGSSIQSQYIKGLNYIQ